MTQEEALQILKQGHSAYLTGAAGSGKTFLLNRFIKHLKKCKTGVGITASTGIAATHLGGMTIHSFAGIGIARALDQDQLAGIVEKRHIDRHFNGNHVLIIDEISMLDADRLQLVNEAAKLARKSEKPFGGMQVVLCGDFFQLPPISREGDAPVQFAYQSAAWQELSPVVCYLTEQFRQGNDALLSVLNAIRDARVDQISRDHLKTRVAAQVAEGSITRLYSHNVDVDAENARELGRLSGRQTEFYMRSNGVPAVLAALKKGCLAPEVFAVKPGAMVMFVKNNFDKGYVNGTIGTVTDFDEEGHPVVRGLNGRKFIATPESWKIEENGKAVASIIQVPLRLAWAITIHKSQGMTLDAAEINLSDAFERGMGYVALSRVKSFDALRLLGFNEKALQVHEGVLEFDKKLRKDSDQAVEKFCGVELADEVSGELQKGKTYSVEEIQKKHRSAYAPWTDEDEVKLIGGFKAGITTAELAQLLGRQAGGIRARLKKLGLVK